MLAKVKCFMPRANIRTHTHARARTYQCMYAPLPHAIVDYYYFFIINKNEKQ